MFATLLLILSVPSGVHVSLTPPTPAPPMTRRMTNDYSTATLAIAANVYTTLLCLQLKYFCWMHAVVEILVLALPAVTRQLPQLTAIQSINNAFFLSPFLGTDTAIFFPPLRIIGACLVFLGSAIRCMCFRELGRHFTFNIALLENHSLVTTGPYSIVRHPSYTAVMIMNIGYILWHASPGSWLLQSGLYGNIIAWTAFLPIITIIAASIVGGIVTRPRTEDELLKKEFGRKWDEWAKRVPYRLVPGIY